MITKMNKIRHFVLIIHFCYFIVENVYVAALFGLYLFSNLLFSIRLCSYRSTRIWRANLKYLIIFHLHLCGIVVQNPSFLQFFCQNQLYFTPLNQITHHVFTYYQYYYIIREMKGFSIFGNLSSQQSVIWTKKVNPLLRSGEVFPISSCFCSFIYVCTNIWSAVLVYIFPKAPSWK